MTKIELLVLRGAMPSSVAISLDVLRTANRLCGVRGRAPIFQIRGTGSGLAAVRPWLADLEPGDPRARADVIVMPGLGLSSDADVTTRLAERDAERAGVSLAKALRDGVEVATSCSGAFLLARAGLLAGKRATTSWWLAPLFRRLHPDVKLDTDALVVRDGGVTTGGAALAQMDLMLSIVSQRAGAALASECARYLLLDARRSQSRYMALGFLAASDDAVARAERWAQARLAKRFSVDDLAAAAGLSPRTFARRVERATGLSPVRFLSRIRVERATELLETTRMTLDEVAAAVGYAEPSTLRRSLREYGLGARDMRAAATSGDRREVRRGRAGRPRPEIPE